MGEEVAEWGTMWGAKVKMPNDMPDDILKDAITFTRKMLDQHPDFENDGALIAEKIKKHFDDSWSPHWHVVIGRNFGSFVNHETRRFVYFYLADKAIMIHKAG